jgi:SpoVK/Ycf46/Vps4 family AAA+-type ATPase
VRRPLYVVGSGDLDTNAKQIDPQLTTIFDIAHTWSAIVLIDEADVFLEERSLNDLGRNALVAVFLRQLEYFQGILFLTTNRVNSFDEAFESRIHVSLRFKELDFDARRQIWMNFFKNMGVAVGSQREGGDVTNEELDKLSKRNINGRQIKNAMRTAQALAINEGEKLGYLHFTQVLDVIDQFHQDLQSGRKRF